MASILKIAPVGFPMGVFLPSTLPNQTDLPSCNGGGKVAVVSSNRRRSCVAGPALTPSFDVFNFDACGKGKGTAVPCQKLRRFGSPLALPNVKYRVVFFLRPAAIRKISTLFLLELLDIQHRRATTALPPMELINSFQSIVGQPL